MLKFFYLFPVGVDAVWIVKVNFVKNNIARCKPLGQELVPINDTFARGSSVRFFDTVKYFDIK